MIIQGKFNSAEIFTDNIDNESIRQIYTLLNNPAVKDSEIAIMPDVHVGKGAVVGLTMTFSKYIIPSIIGVDIGCGISAYKIGNTEICLKDFDSFIRNNIPTGKKTHPSEQSKYFSPSSELTDLIKKICPEEYQRVLCSIGSLGGGNHFLELEKDNEDNIWLVIHSGSRNLGLKVCRYHQNKAKAYIRKEYSGAGAYHGMEYMTLDEGGNEYLHDMQIAQEYAQLNRTVMCQIIVENFFNLKLSKCEYISSIHNYFNFKDKIIRKGAISAPTDEKVIIPLNMRDGSIIATGKGNRKWNYSAPHGAGRLLSRSESKILVSLEEYEKSMEGIFSSCINQSTIDESPMVYKSSEQITGLIHDTVDINFVMKPVYNFKSGNS